eukprot:m.10159 g.10159  ORF g.10159 m.10159 type:complete len:562 (+) comp7250_c0_seq1:129-1814(+)
MPSLEMDQSVVRKQVRKRLKEKLGRTPSKQEVNDAVKKKIKKPSKSDKEKKSKKSKKSKKEKKQISGDQSASEKPVSKKHEKGQDVPSTKKRKRKEPPQGHAPSNGSSKTKIVTPWITTEEATKYRKENDLTITGIDNDAEYLPMTRFEHCGFSPELMPACTKFDKPTAIQAQCWPVILDGKDCIGIASTGSGKTLAFGLPALMIALGGGKARPASGKPMILVVAPTRELASQTADVCAEVGATTTPKLHTVCVYGGVSKHEQTSALRKGVHVVVATPGRLFDLMEQGEIMLDQVEYLVLDEADRMLEEGFEKEIKHFMKSASRTDRQTLMFSATWPLEVQAIGESYMKRPVRVVVGERDRLVSNHNVEQIVTVMEPAEKEAKLLELLKKFGRKERVLIFGLYKKETVRLEGMLRRKGYPEATAINGDLAQQRRTDILEGFKAGSIRIMIATDVAARGLDVRELKYVINYTFPLTVEDYVHRVGRTGRAGAKGLAHTFFTREEKGLAGELGNVLREAKATVPQALMNFGQTTKPKKHKIYGELTATQQEMAGKTATKIKFD